MRLLMRAIIKYRRFFAGRRLSIFAKLGGRKALARSKFVLSIRTRPALKKKHPKRRPKSLE
jgi:hypothetical protein